MTLARRRFLSLARGALAAPILARSAWSQAYPTRPVRMIVPLAAGGPTDVFARLIAQKLSDSTGKQFYVENIPGAGGNIGIGRAAQAAPDGYTILVVASSYVVNPSLYSTIPYDPYKDFDPITIAVANVVALSVNPSLPARTVDELIALIKAGPGKYGYASAGVGQASHLVGETFRLTLGLDLVHVPFNGSGPAIASMVAYARGVCRSNSHRHRQTGKTHSRGRHRGAVKQQARSCEMDSARAANSVCSLPPCGGGLGRGGGAVAT